MILTGRNKINSNYVSGDMLNFENVKNVINTSLPIHMKNKINIDYLLAYHKGIQPILNKEKLIRPEINNILVLNHAQRITRTVVGYFLGNPIQFIQRNLEKKDAIDELNGIFAYETKSAVDKAIGDYQSITGTGYKIIFTDNTDKVPFETRCLSPEYTFVVYENTIAENPLLGVTYKVMYDDDGYSAGYKFYIYTSVGLYEVVSDSDGVIRDNENYVFTNYHVGGVPIIEYPNNIWRLGDWELTLGLMNSINSLGSGRLDDIEQVIQSLLVFTNAEIDSDMYAEMREAGVVLLKNTTNAKSDVKILSNQLDQAGMNLYASELVNILDTLVGVPSRDSGGGISGGDTGQAVELRDGWADLEIVAENKELLFKASEQRSLEIVLEILRNTTDIDLDIMDIDIKFVRNKNHNLLVKTQSYVNMIGTRTISPSDALTMVDIVSDVNEYATRGEDYWDSKAEEIVADVNDNVPIDDIANKK